MIGAGISEEAIVTTGDTAWKKDSSGLRTCWDRVEQRGQKVAEVSRNKDEHCLCKQTGRLISFLVINLSSCSSPKVKQELFICMMGPVKQRSLPVHYQNSTQQMHLVQVLRAQFTVAQDWEDLRGSWKFGAGILSGKPCCQEKHTQRSLQAKAWKCRFIVSRKMTK